MAGERARAVRRAGIPRLRAATVPPVPALGETGAAAAAHACHGGVPRRVPRAPADAAAAVQLARPECALPAARRGGTGTSHLCVSLGGGGAHEPPARAAPAGARVEWRRARPRPRLAADCLRRRRL